MSIARQVAEYTFHTATYLAMFQKGEPTTTFPATLRANVSLQDMLQRGGVTVQFCPPRAKQLCRVASFRKKLPRQQCRKSKYQRFCKIWQKVQCNLNNWKL